MGLFGGNKPSQDKPKQPILMWWDIKSGGHADSFLRIKRAKVPGGWLVTTSVNMGRESASGITFMPDPNHEWDGNSL